MLGENVSPALLLQARSPSLDLDSLYGAGPAEPKSAKFYEADGQHLKVGTTDRPRRHRPAKEGFDLPRGVGTSPADKRKAVIPDPRNDENLAVAQTHAALIRFHNRVVDTLPGSVPQAQRFSVARETVTKHYQWMLRTDYLPRICPPAIVNGVFTSGRKVVRGRRRPTDVPTMPIEFSVAAFRLGHSDDPERRTTGTRSSTTGRERSTSCSCSPGRAATWAVASGSRATGWPTSGVSTTSARPAGPT